TVTDGGRVALRFVITGTNTESFMGMPATGKAMELEVISLMTVDGGKVTELRSQFDQMGLMRQLGLGPGSA
ncbi:MAG: ester cyclase, partial [Acidimicrobiales bacterium]